jgi:hypothetical protein
MNLFVLSLRHVTSVSVPEPQVPSAGTLRPILTFTSANTLVIQDHLMMMTEVVEVTEVMTPTRKTSQHHPLSQPPNPSTMKLE